MERRKPFIFLFSVNPASFSFFSFYLKGTVYLMSFFEVQQDLALIRSILCVSE